MSTSAKPFDMGSMGMGGFGPMLDSVEMVRRAWSSMAMPTSMVPTVDIDELDKRIADLKAVEQWLTLNLNMLHGTIQGLEIQRGTLAAVKAFGANFAAAAQGSNPADPMTAAQQRAAAAVEAMDRAVGSAPDEPATAARQAAGSPDDGRAASTGDSSAGGTGDAQAEGAGKAAAPPAGASLPGLDPNAWWNMLQQNFNQVAEAAMSGVGLAAGAGGAGTGAARATAAKGARSGSARDDSGRASPPKKRAGAAKSGAQPGSRKATGRR